MWAKAVTEYTMSKLKFIKTLPNLKIVVKSSNKPGFGKIL
jgi:hypothetical protein